MSLIRPPIIYILSFIRFAECQAIDIGLGPVVESSLQDLVSSSISKKLLLKLLNSITPPIIIKHGLGEFL